MIRFLFVLGVFVVAIYSTWTMTAPLRSNSSVGSQQADQPWDTSDKGSEVVRNSPEMDSTGSDSLIESMANQTKAVSKPSDDAGLLALRREITRLKAEVDTLRRDVETLAERETLAITEGDFYADEDKPLAIVEAEELAAREESEWQLRQHIASIEDYFQSEIDYTGWSVQAIELIERALQSEMFSKTSLISLECRSSLCRLEVQHDNPQASRVFSNNFLAKVADMFSKFTIDHVDEGDSYSSMVIYLMQEEPK
jgi:hypothetical protein